MIGLISVYLVEKLRNAIAGTKPVENTMLVSIDDGMFAARDWNQEGCRVMGYTGTYNVGDAFNINRVQTIGGNVLRPFIRARVVEKSLFSGELVLAFEILGEVGGMLAQWAEDQNLRTRCRRKMQGMKSAGRTTPKWVALRPGDR